MNTVELVKGKHRHVIRYAEGEEAGALNAMIDMVNRRDVDFSWFDAAVLSHQMGQELAKELRTYLPK
jgi:hypothetical protein